MTSEWPQNATRKRTGGVCNASVKGIIDAHYEYTEGPFRWTLVASDFESLLWALQAVVGDGHASYQADNTLRNWASDMLAEFLAQLRVPVCMPVCGGACCIGRQAINEEGDEDTWPTKSRSLSVA